jgi:hypothetical protein
MRRRGLDELSGLDDLDLSIVHGGMRDWVLRG